MGWRYPDGEGSLMGKIMFKFAARFIKDESGATAIEYGLIAALVAVAIIVGAGYLGNQVNAKFAAVGTAVKSAPTP